MSPTLASFTLPGSFFPVSGCSWRWIGLIACVALLGGFVHDSRAQVMVRSSLSMDTEATPGETYQGTIELYNQDDTLRSAEVSLRDYLFTDEGSTQYADPGSHERSNAPWIEFGSSVVTIPPNEETEVQYEVQVPETVEGEAPVGTYWSMLMVRPLGQGTGPSPDQGVAVRQIRRYGIQVATHMQGSSGPTLEVQSAGVADEEGQPTLNVSLENTGARMASVSVLLELYDEAGSLAREEETSSRRLYPGTSVQYQVPLGEVESGQYEALLVLQPDPGQARGVQYTIEL